MCPPPTCTPQAHRYVQSARQHHASRIACACRQRHIGSGSDSRPATHCMYVVTAEICQGPGTVMLIRTPPTECPVKDNPMSQTTRRRPHPRQVPPYSNVCLPSHLDRSDSATTPSDSISVALMQSTCHCPQTFRGRLNKDRNSTIPTCRPPMARPNRKSNLSLTNTASPWDEPRLKQTDTLTTRNTSRRASTRPLGQAKQIAHKSCPATDIFRSKKRQTSPVPPQTGNKESCPICRYHCPHVTKCAVGSTNPAITANTAASQCIGHQATGASSCASVPGPLAAAGLDDA